MKFFFFIPLLFISMCVWAQPQISDSSAYATVQISKDPRLDVLGEKMAAYNAGLSKNVRSSKGYRLMVLSTNDRNQAMQLRSRLLQEYPEHKVYMIYQNPFIKLKMGNFVEKSEAEAVRSQLMRYHVVPGNVYLLPEQVELRADQISENLE